MGTFAYDPFIFPAPYLNKCNSGACPPGRVSIGVRSDLTSPLQNRNGGRRPRSGDRSLGPGRPEPPPDVSSQFVSSGAGGGAKRRIVEMGVDRGGGALPVPEQLAHGGQPDVVHDALRGVGMAGVVNADAAQPGLLPHPDPEGVETRRSEVFGKHPRRAVPPGQRREDRRETNPFWDRPFKGFPSPDTVRNRPKSTNPTIVAEGIDKGVQHD